MQEPGPQHTGGRDAQASVEEHKRETDDSEITQVDIEPTSL